MGEPITVRERCMPYISSKQLTSTHFCTQLYRERTMRRNASGNFSNVDEFLLDSVPRRGNTGAENPVVIAALVIVGAVGVVGNLLVVIVFIKYKILFRNIKTTLLVNQSVIDGVVSFLIIVTTLFEPSQPSSVNVLSIMLYCKLWVSRAPMWGLMVSSTYNLMAISFERYLAVVHPMWHKVYFTDTMANVIAVCIWFFGVSFLGSIMIPTTGMLHGVCIMTYFWPSRATAQAVGYLQIFVNLVIPIFVHSFCYARMLTVLHNRMATVTPRDDTTSTKHMEKTGAANATPETKAGAIHMSAGEADSTRVAVSLPSTSGTNASTNWKSNVSADHASRSTDKRHDQLATQNEKAKRNVVKTLAIVTACYFICWMPNKIHIVMRLMGVISNFGAFFMATVILAFINCCINPIIYAGKYHAFKTGLSMLLRR